MSAYIVFTREKLHNQADMDVYNSLAPKSMAGHKPALRVLYGAHESLEGAPIEGAVILEFPSMAEAKAWYESPAYQEARVHRFKGADYRAFIVEGV